MVPPFYALFDRPNYRSFPLGLGYLAASIKQNSEWEVKIYDADFAPDLDFVELQYFKHEGFNKYINALNDRAHPAWNSIRDIIRNFRPSVVAISVTAPTVKSAGIAANIIKNVDRDIVIIFGGAHPSIIGEEIFSGNPIDISVIGEGEMTILDILQALECGRSYEGIKGILYRKDGAIKRNPLRELMPDLDEIPFPIKNDPHILYNYEKYPKDAFRSVIATRGCPNRCFFCASRYVWGRKVRYRSPENVAQELKYLQSMGLHSVHFEDDFFGVNKKYLSSLCVAISTHCPGLRWSCEMHVGLVDDDVVSTMKGAGCFAISLGVESGNNLVLSQLFKNITIEKALAACSLIKKYGISLNVYFIIGTPFETEKSLQDTIAVMEKIPCDSITCNTFTPYPGTESFAYCQEKGLIPNDYDPSFFFHQSPKNCFTPLIDCRTFYQLAEKINVQVDTINMKKRFLRMFSLGTIRRLQDGPIKTKFKLLLKIILSKILH